MADKKQQEPTVISNRQRLINAIDTAIQQTCGRGALSGNTARHVAEALCGDEYQIARILAVWSDDNTQPDTVADWLADEVEL